MVFRQPENRLRGSKNLQLIQEINIDVSASKRVTFASGIIEQIDPVAFNRTAAVSSNCITIDIGAVYRFNIHPGAIGNYGWVYRYYTILKRHARRSLPGPLAVGCRRSIICCRVKRLD